MNAVRGVPMPNLGGGVGGPAPPGSGTREPRRPTPLSPAGAAALSLPEGDELPSR
ncbi:MAG TPA: hypothetical protein VFR67_09050 [Pilimelia sp.]|nr:hypothetical protein [Pilimelia sp.]